MPSTQVLENRKKSRIQLRRLLTSTLCLKKRKRKKKGGKGSFLCASVRACVRVYKHLPVLVCLLPASCLTLEGWGIQGSPPGSCVYLVFKNLSAMCKCCFKKIHPPSREPSSFAWWSAGENCQLALTPKVFSHPGEGGERAGRGRGGGEVPPGSWSCRGLRIPSAGVWERYGNRLCKTISVPLGRSDTLVSQLAQTIKIIGKISWNFWVFNYV